ncbi:hypothetical protein Tsubulata_037649, partial [Turnera subulata]
FTATTTLEATSKLDHNTTTTTTSTATTAHINHQTQRQSSVNKPFLRFDHQLMSGSLQDHDEPSLSLGLISGGSTGQSYRPYHHLDPSCPEKMDVKKSPEESVVVPAPVAAAIADLYRPASPPHSAVSSFSSGRVKRERDLSSEETDAAERVSSRVSDEDEDGANARKKLRLSKEQSALLEESFKQHSTLNPKCCETLTDENRRLQKELQELKALKLAQPFYMHMPAATLTMCPSCERIGGVGDAASKSPFAVAPKPAHFYNPFTNPSAAC